MPLLQDARGQAPGSARFLQPALPAFAAILPTSPPAAGTPPPSATARARVSPRGRGLGASLFRVCLSSFSLKKSRAPSLPDSRIAPHFLLALCDVSAIDYSQGEDLAHEGGPGQEGAACEKC